MKKLFITSIMAAVLLVPGLVVRADTPVTPANMSAVSSSPTSITLNWNASTGAVGYNIYRNSTTTPIATVNTTNYINNGLIPATLYSYYIDAYDASGTKSILSAVFSTTTLADAVSPATPANFSAVAVSSSQINLSWTAASDNAAVVGYRIYRNGTLIDTTTGLNHSDTGLAASTIYSYTIVAYDAAGNRSTQSSSAAATTFVATPDTTVPTVPTNLIATPISSSQINLSWKISTDNIGVVGYRIFRNGIQIGTSSKIYFTDRKLVAATSYTYNISAFDAAGNVSGASAELTVSTLTNGQTITGNVSIQIINGDKRGKQINYRSNEIIYVAVYSDKTFSASTINNNSVLFGNAKATSWKLKDVNKDGILDRIYGFKVKNLQNLNAEENILVFSATTKDGKQIYATANVRVKNGPNKYHDTLQKKINELQKKIDGLKTKLDGFDQETKVMKDTKKTVIKQLNNQKEK